MAELLRVNPTRMELKRLQARHKTAVRGHKLLKDKADEMVRQFLLIIKRCRDLRIEVERELTAALRQFKLASAISPTQSIETALAMPAAKATLAVSLGNIMSVKVPILQLNVADSTDLIPYSFLGITADLDASIVTISKLLEKMVSLAQLEKTCSMLADEIEKTRRRVNALEHVLIPQMLKTIKYIKMKLGEDERSVIVRLMKVKSMIQKRDEQLAAKKAEAQKGNK
ncbi:MAG: V-type ATP synthase subunit D [Firmicutes bacterium]|nr:V-type ATP synthase subunit D [Bacillota bacterium]